MTAEEDRLAAETEEALLGRDRARANIDAIKYCTSMKAALARLPEIEQQEVLEELKRDRASDRDGAGSTR